MDGNDLKFFRVIKGLKQKEFAEILGIEHRDLRMYESNSIEIPLVVFKSFVYYKRFNHFKSKYLRIKQILKTQYIKPKMYELKLRLEEEIKLFTDEF